MSLPLTLTHDQAIADLSEIAAAAPERTIDDMGGRCVYFRPDDSSDARDGAYGDLQPGQGCCIVGKVLERRGVTYADLQAERANTGTSVMELVDRDLLHVDRDTAHLLTRVQINQDSGANWDRAVHLALAGIEINY